MHDHKTSQQLSSPSDNNSTPTEKKSLRLRADNRALNDQLARRLGAQRVDNVTRP
jgi:hypothetical protein